MSNIYFAVMSNSDNRPFRLIIRDDARELVKEVQDRLSDKDSTEYPDSLAVYKGYHDYTFYTFDEFCRIY